MFRGALAVAIACVAGAGVYFRSRSPDASANKAAAQPPAEGENAIRAQPISSRRRAAASPKPARRPETADGGGAASRRAASPAPLGRQLLHERRAYGSMYMSLRDGKHFRA